MDRWVAEKQAKWLEKALAEKHERDKKHPDRIKLPVKKTFRSEKCRAASMHWLATYRSVVTCNLRTLERLSP